jgi:hypothetical protein
MSQNEPNTTVAANRLIEQLMRTLLRQSPGITRVRLAVIHGGLAGPMPAGPPRYDVTNGVAARGRLIGPLAPDRPLSDWNDFLPALLAGLCALYRVPAAGSPALSSGLVSSCATSVLVCPATGPAGDLMGAVIVMWDGNNQPPEPVALRRLMDAGRHVATQAAAVLDLCGPQASRDFCPTARHLLDGLRESA